MKLFFLIPFWSLLPFGSLFAQDLVDIKLIDSISVSFDSGSSIIRNPSKLISRINQTKINYGKVQLISYTDTVGSNSYNKNLASKRLLSISRLIKSTNAKDFILDSMNLNEERKGVVQVNEDSFRRVDILIYRVEAVKIKFNVPVNLRINFHSGTDNMVTSSTRQLKMLQLLMEIDTTLHIKLNGHVCCEPDMDLSIKRAQRAKSYLVMNGIDANRISCKGYSNTTKLVPESSDDNKRKNMRVEVVFVK